MVKMDTREGQLNIAVHGAESFGIALEPTELDDRNYKLVFLPYRTERRLSEFDGVITFQRLYEQFERKSNYAGSWTDHSYDRDELDKRKKESDILRKNGGFILFLLHKPFRDHVYDSGSSADYTDTDLVKRFLNWSNLYRDDYDRRLTSVSCVRDEFLRFFELYGAAWSSFKHYGSLPWRNLALTNRETVSMVIGDSLFFVPCLLPEQRSERKEEFFQLLADAVVTCIKKLRVELPPWADEFLLPSEKAILEEQVQLSSRLEVLKKERSSLSRFKCVLVGDSDALVDDVVNLLTTGFGFTVSKEETYREDIRILDDSGKPIIFGEIKGTTRGVKREYINQADSHRERAGLTSQFPTILIINTHTKNTRPLQEKNQAVASEQVKHAVNMNVFIIRTIDMLNLLAMMQKQRISQADILTMFKTKVGWLVVSDEEILIRKE